MNEKNSFGIAIIGLAGRFPQAHNLESFWHMLKNGYEAIEFFSDEELLAEGVDAQLLQHPDYVKAGTVIPDVEYFDAHFFNINARDAAIIDPQQRLFIECAWQALEQAGYPPAVTDVRIGLYAGITGNSYQYQYIEPNKTELLSTIGAYRLSLLSDKDYVTTRTAYTLNLTGPTMTIQAACSTSLVAVHVACQSLLNFECDMVLAGGVSIIFPQKRGYLYQEGMIMSKDGHCRAFDARAQGIAAGCGVGVVLLKRLDEALADGDTIHAVIRGSAVNNDGADKVGYTAPSIKGQTEVILEAQAAAGIHPDEISYIEAHGTGTLLGDPIEIQALTQAFRANTQRQGYCAVGSVKTNIGHPDIAAGIAGLIKTVLALKHRQLPPNLHFERPNPHIDFAKSPFFVNDRLRNWEVNVPQRCAGVNSFGIGGTNAHLIVAEAPSIRSSGPSRSLQLITLSAKTATAVETATGNLAHWLQCHTESSLADVAYTLNRGRQSFSYRRIFVCSQIDDAISQLKVPTHTYRAPEQTQEVVFLFPGQGSQYPKMTQGLYETERIFRETLDHCAIVLMTQLKQDLRDVLYNERNTSILKQTGFTQPVLFAVEYALAQLWMSWGIQPKAMLGHSIGEYVAACLAGVFSLEDALALVAARGQFIQSLPPGAMLALSMSEEKLQPWLTSNLSLAAVNGTQQCVLAGHPEAIEALKQKLQTQGIESRILNTSHGFHSHLLQPILAPFAQRLKQVKLHAPTIPYLSNFTGTWIRPEQAIDPDYWVQHLRHTVRFNENLQALFQHNIELLLEVGPGYTLSALAQQHPRYSDQFTMLPSLPRQRGTENHAEITQMLSTLGQLWAHGVSVNWDGFYAEEQRHRLPLPTYPFERQKYWIDVPQKRTHGVVEPSQEAQDRAHWLYRPVWKKSFLPEEALATTTQHWLFFEDSCGVSQQLQQWLTQRGDTVNTVQMGAAFKQLSTYTYSINLQQLADYESLVRTLELQGHFPTQIVHCWSITQDEPDCVFARTDSTLQSGFYSVFYLIQALKNVIRPLELTIISNKMQAVEDSDWLQPEKTTLLGLLKAIGYEASNIRCRSVDIELPFKEEHQVKLLGLELLHPIREHIPTNQSIVAYRQKQRWIQTYEPLSWKSSLPVKRLRQRGVYLISGGLGGIGLTLAEYLAQSVQARLILIGRSTFPEKSTWQAWLDNHDKNDAISQKICSLQAFEQKGAEILVYSADVTHSQQMQQVIETAQHRFGTINGVIHAAGIASTFIPNEDYWDALAQVLAPKVIGTLVLEQLLNGTQLDFFVLCSSLSSVVGFGGESAYCAANTFQDAFAQVQRQHPQTLFTAINWDGWQKVGMAAKIVFNPLAVTSEQILEQSAHNGLLPDEGVAVFEQVLQHQEPQVLVVKQGLTALFERLNTLFDNQSTTKQPLAHAISPRPTLTQPYVVPRTTIEKQLVEIWQTFLGIVPIGIEDDFFELGGDSLLSVQLIAYLRTKLEMNLGPQALFNTPTIAQLAKLFKKTLTHTAAASFKSELLIEIKSGNPHQSPLFMVHPAIGYVFVYRALAKHLKTEQPIYGIQAYGTDGQSTPLSQVEEMARQYLYHLKARQSKGPYFIGGFSFGGAVAYEIARQLTQQKEEIALLTLIDTPASGHLPKIDIDNHLEIANINDNANIMIGYLSEIGKNIHISLAELRKMDEHSQWKWFMEKIQVGNIELRQAHNFLDLFRANVQALSTYRPQPWKGKAIFFRAMEQKNTDTQPREEVWKSLIQGGMELYFIPGNHLTMNEEPNVQHLAQYLQSRLY